MEYYLMRKLVGSLIASLALLASTPSMAATLWLNGGGTASGSGQTFTDGTVTVRATAWSNSGTLNSGTLGVWSEGMGVQYGTSDNSHTVDNSGTTDFIILQFSQAVSLGEAYFSTGWHYMNDTDATIGFGNSALPITTNLLTNGQAASGLNFLTQYGSGSVGQSGNSWRNINPGGNVGNVWMISAATQNPDNYLDGFKLKKVTYSAAVPEPGTWLMMILGFGLVGGSMRRRKDKGVLAHA